MSCVRQSFIPSSQLNCRWGACAAYAWLSMKPPRRADRSVQNWFSAACLDRRNWLAQCTYVSVKTHSQSLFTPSSSFMTFMVFPSSSSRPGRFSRQCAGCRPLEFCLTTMGVFGQRVPIQDVQRGLHSVVRSLQRQACLWWLRSHGGVW